jgi:hypothetical protein
MPAHTHMLLNYCNVCTDEPSLTVNVQAERAAVETEVQRQLATLQQQQAAAAANIDDAAAAATPGKLCMLIGQW